MSFFDPIPRSLAHRGDSRNYPENTEPAFQAAVKLGVDVVETDVHLTADKKVIIWHDDSLERVSGDPRKIRNLTADELMAVDAGARFTRDDGKTFPFRGKGIHPFLFQDALRKFPETRFNVDLKEDIPELAYMMKKILETEKAEHRVCIGSFHHNVLKVFRGILPETETSLSKLELRKLMVYYRIGGNLDVIRKGKVRAIQIPEYHNGMKILTPAFIRWCKKRNLILQIWTVNEADEMKRLFKAGIDGIFSDNAELVRDIARQTDFN